MSIWEYANPKKFMETSGWVLPWLSWAAGLALATGLVWGFFLTPEADRFGSTVKILYVHVPSAFVAINAWIMMVVASLIWLIRRHHVSALLAKAAAPVGMVMTLIALFTGAVWGAPMWGTWWEWDPRLSSFLILLFFYIGYLGLWSVIENPDAAADLTAVLCLVGSIFALLSRYAVYFWAQGLHQGASLSVDRAQHVADVYAWPLWLSIAGFVLLFLVLVLVGARTEIRARRLGALLAREATE